MEKELAVRLVSKTFNPKVRIFRTKNEDTIGVATIPAL